MAHDFEIENMVSINNFVLFVSVPTKIRGKMSGYISMINIMHGNKKKCEKKRQKWHGQIKKV